MFLTLLKTKNTWHRKERKIMKNNPSATLFLPFFFNLLKAGLKELMVQKDDECIFILVPIQFLFY